MKKLIMISGTMGAGKTSVCIKLQKFLPENVFLDGDWCWKAEPFVVNDETKEMAKEIVRCNAIDRVNMALDYFDASINRISAWTVGFRSWQKALLNALCTPHELLKKLQDNSEFTELLYMHEELKTLPFGDIWEQYLKECGVISDTSWFSEIKRYENEVLSKRK